MINPNERMEWMKTLCRGEGRVKVETVQELAEFMEDVNRIVQCSAALYVRNKTLEAHSDGVELRIQGICSFSVIYRSNQRSGEGRLCGGEFSSEFEYCGSFSSEEEFDPECLMDVTELIAEGALCRPLGPRKLQLRCDVLVGTCIKGNALSSCGVDASREGMQRKTVQCTSSVLLGKAAKEIAVTHEFTLPEEYPPMDRLLDWDGRVFCESCERSAEGIAFRSTALISCCYLPESEQDPSPLSFVLPLEASQRLECDGAGEGEAFVQCYPSELNLEIKEDESGDRRRLRIGFSFLAEGGIYENRVAECVSDCYSTCERMEISAVERMTEEVKNWGYCHAPVEFGVSLKEPDLVRVEMIRCRVSLENCVAEAQGLRAKAKVKTGLLGIKGDGSVLPVKEEAELSLLFRPENVSELMKGKLSLHLEMSAEIKEMDCSVSGDQLLFRGTACAKVLLLDQKREHCVVGMESLGKTEREKDGSVILYYPERDEEAWEIGKRFGIPVDRVQGEMEREGGKFPSVLMLLR